MKFEFKANKTNNTLNIIREFKANRLLVWDCYTQGEYLEQWFAPQPLLAKTKSMDFREGGFWLYAMVEPNGTEHWGRTDYQTIKPKEFYTAMDGFCNSEGELNLDFPQAKWHVEFTDQNENTLVNTTITFNSLKDLELVIEMGMEEGMKSTLDRLGEIIAQL